jgi:hypothetical protein
MLHDVAKSVQKAVQVSARTLPESTYSGASVDERGEENDDNKKDKENS